ncbi:hypothetical protein COV20_06065 [Candidatus Woesearchaeota archaeon CG10_big_fil_rev_8_21_14_0_10_45_16]|nr:MAG: hypothetical protein COV20_06065 [Candidatus Woesearchaeota archaeon CG10_big_fil_rev_8_21_14_0_10_45_16]
MNEQELKEIINIAWSAVKDIEDKDRRQKTYEIIMNNLIGKAKKPEVVKERSKSPITIIDSIEKLAKKLNIDKEKLEDFIEVDTDDMNILFPIKRNSNREEHLIFSLVYLTIRKLCLEVREIESSKLRELMASRGLGSLVNLSTNLKKFPTLIAHKSGKKGSTNTYYRLTIEGFSKGLWLLKEIIEKGNKVEKIEADFLESTRGFKKRAKRSSALSNEINMIIDEGFFTEFKSVNKLMNELRTRGFFNKRQDIDSYLRKVLLGKRLLREKIDGTWNYVIKK